MFEAMTTAEKKMFDKVYAALRVISDGSYVYLCDMKYDISRWSKEAVEYFGLEGELMYQAGMKWEKHIHPEDLPQYQESIMNIFAGKDESHDMQYRAMSADGTYVICTCKGVVINDLNDNPRYFAGSIRNHGLLSYIDNNTGLRNLYGFFDDLNSIVWNKKECTVIMIGVNRFSNINEVYGYNFGNVILKKLGDKIEEEFLNKSLIYKLDGTKFAVISYELDEKQAKEKYNKLQDFLSSEFYVDNNLIAMSVNAGAIGLKNFDLSSKILYSCLKYAYYESKNKKFGDMAILSDVLTGYDSTYAKKINTIRNAIPDGCKGFFLCYQPIVDASNEKLIGLEALIRYKDDKYGVVPPNLFIPVLEYDTVFTKLGLWILKTAMTDGKKMLKYAPDFVMNINLSFTQIEKSSFLDDLFKIVNETGFPTENLCLEITERCRLINIGLLKNTVDTIRSHGIRVALDDFGTGYSSLGILRMIQFDEIKVDRGYVKDVETQQIDKNTVMLVADASKLFNSKVCIEGVETESMQECLREFNVDAFQGYYYSRPVPFDDIMEYIKKKSGILKADKENG